MAAILVQKVYRGWHLRQTLKTLRRKALLEHGKPWIHFIANYRELVAKIRSRYCITKTSCPTDLKQIHDFMDKKLKYEKVFGQMAPSGKLHKEALMEYFNRCDLWPTQRDINRCFDVVFRGSRNTAEVVFLLDCSSSIGLMGYHKLTKLVKDIILSLDIAPDRTRVGVVPYNESVFNSFDFTLFNDKKDILAAISLIKLRNGVTRTDIALREAKSMFKDARAGVQKIAILITDGRSTYPEKTLAEGKLVRDMGVQVFAIGVGDKANEEELGLLATSADHCYKALDVKSLSHIRRQIEKRLCLVACGFCQYLLPRIQKAGLTKYETIDLMWTLYPPTASGIKNIDILRKLPLDSLRQAIKIPSVGHVSGSVNQSEALDVVWMLYPPDACGLQSLRKSRWIRPVVEGEEAWSLLDDDIMRATGMRACLRLVVQAKLSRAGFMMVPSSVREGVEKATTETQVMQAVDRYMLSNRSFLR